jgi:calcineurin-like phosphoesterase family protein
VIWLTSDTHFGHDRIRQYSARPFTSVADMDARLILNWNVVVKPNDDVYHLGDIFLCREERALAIRKQLNGRIHLILGNHDKTALRLSPQFVWTKHYHWLTVQDQEHPRGRQEIALLHYAMRVWSKAHYGSFHAYGHSHGSLPEIPTSRSMDVGVDAVATRLGGGPDKYRPISYLEFKEWMLAKDAASVDHHIDRHRE